MSMKKIVAFDFDGTLTHKDSFVEFIKFTKGNFKFYIMFPIIGVLWVLSQLKIIKTHKAKEFIFKHFYKGTSLQTFDEYCYKFANHIDKFLKDNAKPTLQKQLLNNDEALIVSASIENWIIPWAKNNGVNTVIATKIEVDKKGILTGKFSTPNCNGIEKVKRVLKKYPNLKYSFFTVYGNSSGDKPLMYIANKVFWRTLN